MIKAATPAADPRGSLSRRDSVPSTTPPLSRFRTRLFGSGSSPKIDLCSCRAEQRSCAGGGAAAAAATFHSAAEDISEQGEELLAYVVLVELLRSGVRLPPSYLDGLPRTPYGEYSFKWRSVTLLVTDAVERLRCNLQATVDRMVDRLGGEMGPEVVAPGDFRKVLADAGVAGYPLPSRVALVLLFSARLAVDTCCRHHTGWGCKSQLQQQLLQPSALPLVGKPCMDEIRRDVDSPAAAAAGEAAAVAATEAAAALTSLHAEAWESVRLLLLPEVTSHGGWMQAMLNCECRSNFFTGITSSVISRGLAIVGPALSALVLFVIWLRKKAFQLEES